ncbi:hypothetical protein CRG98_046947, partial [Punica granatum]
MSMKLKLLDSRVAEIYDRTLDFSVIPVLEQLILKGCRSLVAVDPSIGHLKHLISLKPEEMLETQEAASTVEFHESVD